VLIASESFRWRHGGEGFYRLTVVHSLHQCHAVGVYPDANRSRRGRLAPRPFNPGNTQAKRRLQRLDRQTVAACGHVHRQAAQTDTMSTTTTDALLGAADSALRTLFVAPRATRECPTLPERATDAELAPEERQLSGALMRVNHVGEVCAQALYTAQALAARWPRGARPADEALAQRLEAAGREETDHLAWTQARLDELGARPSLLNPLWYTGAFGLGLLAGRGGNRAPGGGPSGKPHGSTALCRPRLEGDRGADEGRRGPTCP
jgi:hypothetical protein